MSDLIYNNCVASYRLLGQHWRGTIRPLDSGHVLPNPQEVTATEAEGEPVFIARAKARIDQDIAERAEAAKKSN